MLGFLDDHTSIVEAQSYTYVFLAAIVLEVLTCAAFAVKDAIVGRLRHRDSSGAIALMVFGVWFVMFTSKFVFIWAIDLVFGDAVNINGFFGIFVVALVVTVVHRLADWVFIRLGRSSTPRPSRCGTVLSGPACPFRGCRVAVRHLAARLQSLLARRSSGSVGETAVTSRSLAE